MSIMRTSLQCLVSGSCSGQRVDNSTVSSFELSRHLGDWYEIARCDHSFERGSTHAKANNALNPDGTIAVTNSGLLDGKRKESVGKAKTTGTAALLRVSFFGPFYSDYRVMMLAEDYSYVLVGSKSAKYLWILSRPPELPEDVLKEILSVATNCGYDTN